MKFDVVIGNPPYNNDLYLDFVKTGYDLLKDDGQMIMITPAKWQAKGGRKNEDFRANIVPRMKELIYFPYTDDVFDVTEVGGITYYCVMKGSVDKLKVSIKKNTTSVFHREETFEICTGDKRFTYYDHVLENIVAKAGACGRLNSKMFGGVSNTGDYMVRMSHLADDKRRSSCIGGFITTPAYVEKYGDAGQNMFVVTRGSKEYCESFKSYIYTKFVRFLVALGMCASSVRNEETWRFVPDPGPFDHIFTDKELYEKYGLTDDEIAVIESVIKERK